MSVFFRMLIATAVTAIITGVLAGYQLAHADVAGSAYNPGSMAGQSSLSGCVYRAKDITAADGQQMAIACSPTGATLAALIVNSDGGAFTTNFRLLASAASTNATNVKSKPGNLYIMIMHSNRASDCYLKLYDKATTPVPGTDTPVMTITIPGTSTAQLLQIPFSSIGYHFSAGIGFAITANVADADTTAIAASDITGLNFVYQ